jgi:hypothetical protein
LYECVFALNSKEWFIKIDCKEKLIWLKII